jgi:hypothetical protein
MNATEPSGNGTPDFGLLKISDACAATSTLEKGESAVESEGVSVLSLAQPAAANASVPVSPRTVMAFMSGAACTARTSLWISRVVVRCAERAADVSAL